MPNKTSENLPSGNDNTRNFNFFSRVSGKTSCDIKSVPYGNYSSPSVQALLKMDLNIKVQYVDDILVIGKSEK